MRTKLLTLSIFVLSISFAQTYHPDCLDGRVLFKLKVLSTEKGSSTPEQTNPNIYSLEENLQDYPTLSAALKGIEISKLERPSYYTEKPELMNIFKIHFEDYTKADEIIERLSALKIVEYAEKDPLYKLFFTPNDPKYTTTGKWYHDVVNSEAAWDISQGSSNVKLAIVDNAVFADHEDLTTWKRWDAADKDNDPSPPSPNSPWHHGTHTAGLATGNLNNEKGIASLGGNVELIAVKMKESATGKISATFEGVQWACENGAHIVSMSWGSETSSEAYQDLFNAYPDIVFIAAVGNEGISTKHYPAAYNNVIGVGSVNSDMSRSSFSNFNATGDNWVDICAPGGSSSHGYGLLSAIPTSGGGSGYGTEGGTSMACPFAAGLIGLMLSVDPSLTPTEIETCLISSGQKDVPKVGQLIDAHAALQCVQSGMNGDPIAAFSGDPYNIHEGQSVSFIDNSVDGGKTITSWEWTFENGSPSSHNGQTPPSITYATIGKFDVTLKVTNSKGSTTATKTDYVKVTPTPVGNWIEQASTFTTPERGVIHISIVDANTVWGIADDGSKAAAKNVQEFTKTTNGGSTWTSGKIDVGNSALGIAMIHALNANTAWVPSFPNGSGQTGGIFKTTDGGTNWTRQNSASFNDAASFANLVYFWDANIGFSQGDPVNGEFEIYTTTNGGTTWTITPDDNIADPLNGEYNYTGKMDVVGDYIWFGTNKGRMYRSSDKGKNLTVHTTPLSDFAGSNFSFKSTTEGMIIDKAGKVYQTTDGGESWSATTTTGTVFPDGVCWIEGTNTLISVGESYGVGGSSYSTDGGKTWVVIDSEQHLYVEFIDENTGWTGGLNQSDSKHGMWKWDNITLATDDVNNTIVDLTDFFLYPNPTSNVLNIVSKKEMNRAIQGNIVDISGRLISPLTLRNITTIDVSAYHRGVYFLVLEDGRAFKFIKK